MWWKRTFRFWSCYVSKVLNDLFGVLRLPSSRLPRAKDGLVLSICRIEVKGLYFFMWSRKPWQNSQFVCNKTSTPLNISWNVPTPVLAVTRHGQQAPLLRCCCIVTLSSCHVCCIPIHNVQSVAKERILRNKRCHLLMTHEIRAVISQAGSHDWCYWQIRQ